MYDAIITNCARIYKIDEKLIRAIIRKESSWNQYAIRPEPSFWKRYLVGIKALFYRTPEKDEKWLSYPTLVSMSYGLAQIMLTTAMELGFRFRYPTELLDPETNIKYECLLLKKNFDRYGDWNSAIAAYNQGNDRRRSDGKFKNQESYVDVVLKYFEEETG